jgi:hypothetical protein
LRDALTKTKNEAENQGRLRIRAHHLFCMVEALATGKSDHESLGPIAQKILSNPGILTEVVVGADDICVKCKHLDNARGLCMKYPENNPLHLEFNEKGVIIDKRALLVLQIENGDVMRAIELYLHIKEKVAKKTFVEKVCWDCINVGQCGKMYEQNMETAVMALNSKDPRRSLNRN